MSDLNDYIKGGASPLRRALGGAHRPVKLIEWPEGVRTPLRGVPLAVREVDSDVRVRAASAALEFLTTPTPKGAGFPAEHVYSGAGAGELELETKIQVLAHALVEPAPPHAPAVTDAADLRALVSADEVAFLFERLLDLMQERSPFSSSESWEKLEATLAGLGKGTIPPSSLSGFDAATLRSIVLVLAARLWKPTNSPSLDT